MARDPEVLTAAELERLSPDARDAAIRERMVTDPDQADPGLLDWARTQGRALLEASS
jgi:hypothetical protein